MTAPPLLQVQDLVKTFDLGRAGQVHAVRGVSLRLEHGRTLGLVGESGCGKTTLGRCVLGLRRPTSGRVLLDGAEITGLSGAALRPLRRQMQLVFQDPHASLDPRMTVEQIVAEPLVIHRLARGRGQQRERVEQLLQQVGLDPQCTGRYPHEFSGGQRQRIAIARALASEPRLVVADEPTSALDVPVRARIIKLLRELQHEHGLALLLISHDLLLVRHAAHEVAVMYSGRLVELGSAAAVVDSPRHPYTQALKRATPRITAPAPTSSPLPPAETEVPRSGCPYRPRCPLFAERKNPRCTTEMPELSPAGQGHRVACHEVGGTEG